MFFGRSWAIVLAVLVAGLLLVGPSRGEEETDWSPGSEPPPVEEKSIPAESLPRQQKISSTIEAVVINPYRSANVGGQVGGIIERFNAEEGDRIEEGQIVVELYDRRYLLLAERARERVRSLEVAFSRAEEEARIKGEVYDLDATTRQEVLKARSEAEIARYRLAEAKRELDLAVFDLDACKIQAPFTGYLASKFKQTDETAERLEKIFAIVDTTHIYAVANIPEESVSEFGKGAEAVFIYGDGKEFKGKIDRVGKLIDPKSRTKRVYVLIDNRGNELEAGMSGSLRLLK
jgi:RND family efflux transporter MFP subunit